MSIICISVQCKVTPTCWAATAQDADADRPPQRARESRGRSGRYIRVQENEWSGKLQSGRFRS